ncbi:MAG: hypothetical protein ACYC1F_09170 [Gallionellaceae bacterium]
MGDNKFCSTPDSIFTTQPPNPAKLAAMVPNPRYYDTHREAHGLLRKTGIILGRMNDVEIP